MVNGISKKYTKKILEYLKKDKSFVNIAKQFSESPQGKSGGDLGWVQEGHLISEIDESLKEMKEGEIRLTQSLSGYHILYLRKKRIVGKSGREELLFNSRNGKPGQDTERTCEKIYFLRVHKK